MTHSVHKVSRQPMGMPADQATRRARMRVHVAFDPLWRDFGVMTREDAYRWLIGGTASANPVWDSRRSEEEPMAEDREKPRPSGRGAVTNQLGMGSEECHIGRFDLETCEQALRVIKLWEAGAGDR